jgi:hypothetical protein
MLSQQARVMLSAQAQPCRGLVAAHAHAGHLLGHPCASLTS